MDVVVFVMHVDSSGVGMAFIEEWFFEWWVYRVLFAVSHGELRNNNYEGSEKLQERQMGAVGRHALNECV